jgi:hypothetical protein
MLPTKTTRTVADQISSIGMNSIAAVSVRKSEGFVSAQRMDVDVSMTLQQTKVGNVLTTMTGEFPFLLLDNATSISVIYIH